MNAAIGLGQYVKTCCVVNEDCLAPACGALGGTKAECFACGLPACTKCSTIRRYYTYGRRRVCDACQEQHYGNGTAEVRRRYERRHGVTSAEAQRKR